MTTINLLGHELEYFIVYQKNRKTIKIKFASPTQIEITAPTGYPRHSIKEMLLKKSTWLIKRLNHLTDLAENPVNKTLADGAQILYRGEIKTLKICAAPKTSVTLGTDTIEAMLPVDSSISKMLLSWYLKNAETVLLEKTNYWAKLISVQPTRLIIRDQKTRWGSCSSRGSINYNWRIIMAPDRVIDYLVIHELCHLQQPNHSAKFWQLVSQFDPDFQQHRRWLHDNGGLLGSIFS